MEVSESTDTLDFHSSRVNSGIGYRNTWTLGDLASGGAMATSFKIGSFIVPKTRLLYRKAVEKARVSPTYRDRCRGFQIARRLMHVACVGCLRGVNVGIVGPVHLVKGRDVI